MKKNLILCPCGSGKRKKSCCQKALQVKVFSKSFISPEERQELLTNLAISAEFDMRYRGLFEYYGSDLIAYKRHYGFQKNCNYFLRHFSKYMTDYLEDNCPPAWSECNAPFWDELIYAYLPTVIKITPKANEIEKFLAQLEHFVRWLDKRVGTSSHKVIKHYIEEAILPLKQCGTLLHHLFLINFPDFDKSGWDHKQDIKKIEQIFKETTDHLDRIFEVTEVIGDTVILTDVKTKRGYPLKGLPCNFVFPGMFLDGIVGRRKDDMFWNWFHTNNVFPERAKKYINLI
jgi:hypothetical protein